jgi:L-asparaginase II
VTAAPPGRRGPAVLAEVVRSGFVEGRHRGSLVVLDESGNLALGLGEPDAPIFPRSSSKPLQAAGMLHAGLDLDGELLALAIASHSGAGFHLDGVRRILAGAGLDVDALRTPPDLPLGVPERRAWVREGRRPDPLAMNCSGKHAAMLATCVARGWPLEDYRDPAHPLQRALATTVEDLTGEPIVAVGVDGCGAPQFATSLLGLARAFHRLATAPRGTAEQRTAAAISAYPLWIGGEDRDVTRLIAAVPGLVAKDGAEGVYALALPDGAAIAIKIDDGAARARPPVLVAALRRLGLSSPQLDAIADAPLLGGGRRVGEVRATL